VVVSCILGFVVWILGDTRLSALAKPLSGI
jgi:hypothetical protein